MIVRELMTHHPIAVRPETTVKAALRLLDDNNITMLPVVAADRRVHGVVSEADLIRDLVDRDPRDQERPRAAERTLDRPRQVVDVMSNRAVTVRPETDVAVAVEIATSTGIKSLPVVDERDRLVGVLSRRDVVRVLAREDELVEAEIDGLLVSVGFRDWLVDVHDGIAEITGPAGTPERGVVRALAGSVPGVLEVRVD
jgi:CBS-domain-containing membrane protein